MPWWEWGLALPVPEQRRQRTASPAPLHGPGRSFVPERPGTGWSVGAGDSQPCPAAAPPACAESRPLLQRQGCTPACPGEAECWMLSMEPADKPSTRSPLWMVPREIVVQRQERTKCGETLNCPSPKNMWEEERKGGRVSKQPHVNAAQQICECFALDVQLGSKGWEVCSEQSVAGRGSPLVRGQELLLPSTFSCQRQGSALGKLLYPVPRVCLGQRGHSCVHAHTNTPEQQFLCHFTLTFLPRLLLWPLH